jgi:hypothetical protein
LEGKKKEEDLNSKLSKKQGKGRRNNEYEQKVLKDKREENNVLGLNA